MKLPVILIGQSGEEGFINDLLTPIARVSRKYFMTASMFKVLNGLEDTARRALMSRYNFWFHQMDEADMRPPSARIRDFTVWAYKDNETGIEIYTAFGIEPAKSQGKILKGTHKQIMATSADEAALLLKQQWPRLAETIE